jgi:hypothetical protein
LAYKKKAEKTKDTPEGLKPFLFHGVDLDWKVNTKECVADECPFCHKEGKFSVNKVTSKFDCKSCSVSGNGIEFIRQYYDVLKYNLIPAHEELKTDRKLLSANSLVTWGIRWSYLKNEWVVPAYNEEGKLCQLYAYRNIKGKRRLLATPTFSHGVFGDVTYKKSTIVLCEGIWDSMALWECLEYDKNHDFKTPNKSEVSVLGLPGCNIMRDNWLPLFSGKKVFVAFDNDHPITNEKTGQVQQAGWKGLQSIVSKLKGSKKPPESVGILQWGPDGYNPLLPDGCDVRDYLTGAEVSA